MESTDCGPACLQMVCAFYGKAMSQQYIKAGMSISRIGVTIRDIKDRATDLGFDTLVAKASINQLTKIQSPVIVHWNNNHFIISPINRPDVIFSGVPAVIVDLRG